MPLLQRHLQPRRQVDPEPRSPSRHNTEEPLSLCSHHQRSWWRKLPAVRDRPRSAIGSTAEHCGARPNVNRSPGRTRQLCASYITISSTGPASSQGHGRHRNSPSTGPPGPGGAAATYPPGTSLAGDPARRPGRRRCGPRAPVVPRRRRPAAALAGRSAWRGSQRRRAAPSGPPAAAGRPARGAAGPGGLPPRAAGASCGPRPGGRGRRDLRVAGGVRERRDDGQGQMAAPLARIWGGLPISASAGPPARS